MLVLRMQERLGRNSPSVTDMAMGRLLRRGYNVDTDIPALIDANRQLRPERLASLVYLPYKHVASAVFFDICRDVAGVEQKKSGGVTSPVLNRAPALRLVRRLNKTCVLSESAARLA